MKWPHTAPNTRDGITESLTNLKVDSSTIAPGVPLRGLTIETCRAMCGMFSTGCPGPPDHSLTRACSASRTESTGPCPRPLEFARGPGVFHLCSLRTLVPQCPGELLHAGAEGIVDDIPPAAVRTPLGDVGSAFDLHVLPLRAGPVDDPVDYQQRHVSLLRYTCRGRTTMGITSFAGGRSRCAGLGRSPVFPTAGPALQRPHRPAPTRRRRRC